MTEMKKNVLFVLKRMKIVEIFRVLSQIFENGNFSKHLKKPFRGISSRRETFFSIPSNKFIKTLNDLLKLSKKSMKSFTKKLLS